MIAIYSNNTMIDLYIRQLKFSKPHQVYHSIEEYSNAPANFKLALVNHLNNYEPPADEVQRIEQTHDGRKFSQEISQLKLISDLLFAFDNEMHSYHLNLFQQHSQDNVYWVSPIQINFDAGINPKNLIFYQFQVDRAVNPYRNMLHKLQQLNYNSIKPMYFDALLGAKKLHRDFVYNAIEQNHLQQKILTTYMQTVSSNYFKKNFLREPEVMELGENVNYSAPQVMYQGELMALSTIVPIQIYNQTAYSIVTETNADNRYSFFCEKTFKPMLARRLFVMFSGYKFLENLRNLGFQTFDNVIDESYDLILDDQTRWQAAFEQVMRLCDMNQLEVFEKISQRVEHNYQLVMSRTWEETNLMQIQQKIYDYQH
jgi:hypothetical protein